jgi:pSer/pThr/pTyr-binding forkhead associated (FHA) protein
MTTAEQMPDSPPIAKKGFSIDWLVKGSLTKIGDIFDRLTGRGWKPSSTLATSELIERMKSMMDAEVRENGDKRKYVPHNIKLKMQWDKFSTDAEGALQKLENEFLIAAVDHINDKHYFTHAPLAIEVKPDYFTSGVKLFLSFDKLEGDGNEAELDVTLDNLKSSDLLPESADPEKHSAELRLSFVLDGKQIRRDFSLEEGKRLSVGRTKENDLAIDNQSISKAHASLLLNKEGKLVVADTGSTNGTFVRAERIAYGKAVEISTGVNLLFGLVKVDVKFDPKERPEVAATQAYKVGDMEFTSRTEIAGGNPSSSEGAAIPRSSVAQDILPAGRVSASEGEDGNPSSSEGSPIPSSSVAQGTLPTGRVSASDSEPPPTVASIPVKQELLTPVTNPTPPHTDEVAPPPSLTETKIEVDKEKQDWEV